MTAEEITEKLKADERNQSYTERGISPVFQVSGDAKILIIGQAPGRKVEESGIPFNDKSGEKLMRWASTGMFSTPRQLPLSRWTSIIPARANPAICLPENSLRKNIIRKFWA